MEIEYHIVKSQHSLEMEELNSLGEEGWCLACIHRDQENEEVSYLHFHDVEYLFYHFWRTKR